MNQLAKPRWQAWHRPPGGRWKIVGAGDSYRAARAFVRHLESGAGDVAVMIRGNSPHHSSELRERSTGTRTRLDNARKLLPFLSVPMTRKQIQTATGWSRATVLAYLGRLKLAGLVRHTTPQSHPQCRWERTEKA